MTIGVNWKPIWKPVWKPVWRQGAPVPPTPSFGGGGDGVGMPGRTSYFDEQRKRIERENREELELIQVLTEFLGHQ